MHDRPAAQRAARRLVCVAVAVLFAAGALSCAEVAPAIHSGGPTARQAPAPTRGESVLSAPGAEQPSAASAMSAPGTTAEPADGAAPQSPEGQPPSQPPTDQIPAPPTSNLIALILPLDVPAYARAAKAVRDGFMDAAQAAGAAADCMVISQGQDGVIPAFEAARAKGVRVAVGPLVRDDLKTLVISGLDLPWTLALNAPDDGSALPRAVYTFPLGIESDARVLVKTMHDHNAQSVDIVEGDSPLMKRFATAFAGAWRSSGGVLRSDFRFDATPEALAGLRRSLDNAPPDAVLLAMNGDRAAQVKPYLGALNAYASGLVFERPSPATAHDLDGVQVVAIPWLLTPDAPEIAALPRRAFDSDALAQLYAFGLDAFRIAATFGGAPPAELEFDGATGHITLTGERQFRREGRLGIYRGGELVPLEPAP